ncbi:multidrug ABC transporter ATPase [Microbacterium invictum]|uniref:Multidrug ABC transporter ATPase n=1 Tax=Microbacterium invictum TaxID=515415 RepID=A0AA40SLX3_9MICO|nr:MULTISPECIES: multidrug ABC transporter ATPase [Microbacterium]MBB4138510.1 hypothetical protein [Microbacterium invictum]
MSKQAAGEQLPVRRVDRILAATALGLMVLSIVCFAAIFIGGAAGMEHADFGEGLWPVIGTVVYIAPIAGFISLMIVLISTFVRKARANKGR